MVKLCGWESECESPMAAGPIVTQPHQIATASVFSSPSLAETLVQGDHPQRNGRPRPFAREGPPSAGMMLPRSTDHAMRGRTSSILIRNALLRIDLRDQSQ